MKERRDYKAETAEVIILAILLALTLGLDWFAKKHYGRPPSLNSLTAEWADIKREASIFDAQYEMAWAAQEEEYRARRERNGQ